MGGRKVHDSKVHRQEPDKKRVRGITSGCTGSPIKPALPVCLSVMCLKTEYLTLTSLKNNPIRKIYFKNSEL